MTFQPRMNNRISGFDVVGVWKRRIFPGIVVDLWDVQCAHLAGGLYVAEDPRLFIILETSGDGTRDIAMTPSGGPHIPSGASPLFPTAPVRLNSVPRLSSDAAPSRRLSYIPAGMELRTELQGVRSIRHLDLHFDIPTLARRLGAEIDPDMLLQPRLMFSDPHLLALADLLAADCAQIEPLHDLYADGLALGLFVALMDVRPAEKRARGALAPWQLRRATAFIETHCRRGIRLEELARLTGLSPSHFSQAFKASTGMPPHHWHMKARIEDAKSLLLARATSLSDVAAMTGFADQAHFTRTFRKISGTTPGRWLRSR